LIKDNIFVGDPTQVAGLNAAVEAGLDIGKIKREYGKLASEFSFDSQRKMMSVVYSKGDVFVSGAPEAVLKKCSSIEVNGMSRTLTRKDNEIFIDSMNRMSKDSLRVIAFARKKAANAGINQKEAESGLALIGMIGLIDPPRKDVKEAVAECHDAGIRVIMITGDNADTAKAIARKAGIDAGMVLSGEEIDKLNDEELSDALKKASVFARVSPEHKLRIINSLKDSGEIVAVTGDGINDAPALSNAHIGIAMGETGTDVAREASSMVLTDDNFSTIAGAVREGRKIFDNMKKGIRYYLSCKVALITIFLLPVLFSLSLPFAPVQIILLELFMDIAASAGFSIEKAEADIMKRKPRDAKEKFLNKEMIKSIIIPSVCLVAAVLFSYFLSIYEGADIPKAQTMAFATWIFGHIFLAFNMRSEREPVYKLGFFSNKAIVIWAAAAIGTLIFAVNVPYLENVLRTTALSFSEWASVIIVSFIATFWMEANKILKTFK
jgi:Ca2+-transporting ATPase